MINYPESYFHSETRDGFFIESKMKRAWAAQIEVLEEIRRVCQKNNIRFFADWGSLLGAVRHGGFIPWDDDLDIGMLRDDYNRFLKLAPSELTDFFELKSVYNDPEHDNVKCRVITGRYMNFSSKYLQRFHKCPYVVGVDIFPIDYIPDDKQILAEQIRLINLVMSFAASIPDKPPYPADVISCSHQLERLFGVKFNPENRLFHEAKKLTDLLCAQCHPSNSHEVCSMIDLATGWDYHIPIEWYSQTQEMPFEYTTIPVPCGYDGILKTKYGDDYMIPKQCGGSHDYPFYKKQELALKTVIEKEFKTQISDTDFQVLLEKKIEQSV